MRKVDYQERARRTLSTAGGGRRKKTEDFHDTLQGGLLYACVSAAEFNRDWHAQDLEISHHRGS